MEGGNQYLQEMEQSNTHQRLHILVIQGSLEIPETKNCVKNATVTQCWIGKNLYLVLLWFDSITILESYPGTSYKYPTNTIRVENSKNRI